MTVTSDASAPLVVIVGATGIQGGSVIRSLIESDQPYRLRGLTRDASKPTAKDLDQLGVEVYQGNLVIENASAVKDAFKGVDIAFVRQLGPIAPIFWQRTDTPCVDTLSTHFGWHKRH